MDSEDEFYNDDSDDGSDQMDMSVSVSKKPSFQTLSTVEIVKLMNEEIEHVESIALVEMPKTTIRILLSHTKWDKQELLDRLTDEKNRNKFFEDAHVRNPFKNRSPPKRLTRRKITCSICFTDFAQENIVGLGCGHEYCKDCWRQYLTFKISDGENAESIRCASPNCGIVVDDDMVLTLVSDPNTIQRYKQLMTSSFVENNHSLRWCPAPSCAYAVKVNHLLEYLQNCTCAAGHDFCFTCGDEPHDPIPCKLIKDWKKNDNDSTIEYLLKHTKCCPKCTSSIEKNGGCNHMTCRKCGHEFCWLCFGNWKAHKNGCNRYDGDATDVHDKKRWEHYFKRYGVHKKSLKSELDYVETKIQGKMSELQVMGKSWNEVQFLMKAVEVLWNSRKQLMFTYIFAYFVAPHNQKTIFESNQKDLEAATEALSECFEQELTSNNAEEIMHNFMNKSSYCQRRQKVIQDHIFEGSEENWWTFLN